MIANATTVLIYLSGLFSLIFVVGYTVLAKWWESVNGRWMFSLGVVILGVSTLGVLSQLLGQDYGARPWVRFAVWAATAAVTFGSCVALWRAQGRRKK